MLQKSREVSIASAMRVSNMSVVDAAKAAREPYRPNRSLFAIVGSASGMFLGLAFVLFPRASRSITYHADEGMGKLFYRPEWHFLPPVEGGIIPPELMTFAESDHRFAEVARSALASILLRSQPGSRPRVFVIGSRRQGDGRTTVAANLAVALAQARSRTLLIDGDLRKGRFHELFNTSNVNGLTTILSAKCSFENYSIEAIAAPTDVANLFLLSCGPSSSGDANLLFGERLSQLFSFLRTRFENIVIDSPPASMFADVRLLAANSDGVVLVVRPDSEEAEFSAMLESFSLDNIPVLGTIVNAGSTADPMLHTQASGLVTPNKASIFSFATQSDLRRDESF
jgi:capsular exopolysaccharide synthesis family protein